MSDAPCEHYVEGRCIEENGYCFYNANRELCDLDKAQLRGERILSVSFVRPKTFYERYGVREYGELLNRVKSHEEIIDDLRKKK